jgi:hypothetical protein
MSEPIRYEYVSDGYTARFINPKTGHAAPYGEFVRREDYALLKAAFDLLDESIKLGPSTIPVSHGYYVWKESEQYSLKAENARLKAEVERLTKAGDEMAADLIGEFGSYNSVYDWNAAKEGKQSNG